jgi:F-type H+-transporting ATPase subunit alpha
LLERAARRSNDVGGGSITVLAVAETEEGALTAFIPTNLIGIADGQIVTDADRAARGEFPAIDLGRSVSRVGGRAQPRVLASVAGRTRTAQARFEDLERLTRFATDARGDARRTLERGRRVRWALRQGPLETMAVPEQVADLWAATQGAYDALDEKEQMRAMTLLRASLSNDLVGLRSRLEDTADPPETTLAADLEAVVAAARRHADEVRRASDGPPDAKRGVGRGE